MAKRTFTEYLNTKNKIDKPKVKVVADEVDIPKDREVKPPHFMGMTKDAKAYKQPQADGDKKGVKYGKNTGLGDMGDKDCCYDVTKDKKPAKIPTAESFFYVFPKVRNLIQTDPELVTHLVREFKNNGILSILIAELATHNETFKHLAELMGSEEYGHELCNKLVKSMTEDIAPPMDDEMEDEDDEEDEEEMEDEENKDMKPIEDNDEENPLVPNDSEEDNQLKATTNPMMKPQMPALENLKHALKLI